MLHGPANVANLLSDAAMAASYIGIGAIIFWFGRRRPDMGPAVLFNALALVFALCGLTHAGHVFGDWLSSTAVGMGTHVVAAIASIATLAVLMVLAPRSLRIPSAEQMQDVNNRLARETSEHQQTTTQLRKLAAAVEQNPAIILITDSSGRIEYVNQAFETITGYRRTEAVGRTPALIRSPETPDEVHAEMWNALAAGRPWRGELRDLRRDGTPFWVSTSIAPLTDDDGTVVSFVAIQQDISEQKLAAREMAEARAQAEIANRAKSELLANMSHELRTPLNAILGFSGLMEQELLGPLGNEKYREYIGDIGDIGHSANHLLELINDVLDVSAIEAGKLTLHEEPCHLPTLIQAAVRLVAPRAEKGGLEVVVDAVPPVTVQADPRRLKQVVLNLLTNAVKFTPGGGSVVLGATPEPDDGLAIHVRDTGVGMSREDIIKALQPFGQVDTGLQRKYDGTGLGLPITISLVEMHGGTCRIDSEPGLGTTVTVTLPPERVDWTSADADPTYGGKPKDIEGQAGEGI